MREDNTTRPLGWEMSRHPGLWRRLLAVHRPDDRGRCAGCRAANTLAPRWPCSIAGLAEAARRIAEAEEAEEVPGED